MLACQPPPAPPPAPPRPWLPDGHDPRWAFAALLTLYAVIGVGWLGFNRQPAQIAETVAAACLLDMALAWVLRRQKLFPLSAYITGLGLSLLLNYAHDWTLPLVPVVLAIGSKYLLTFQGRHVFNPGLFGVTVSLLVTGELITAAPAYQWGGTVAMAVFVAMAALMLFVFRIGRGPLVWSFIGFYMLQTALRAWIVREHLPPETLFLGTLTSAPFFLFTFYMITDPATSPRAPRAQVTLAAALTVVDLLFHLVDSVYTFFFAAFTIASCRFVYLHARAWRESGRAYWPDRLASQRPSFGLLGGLFALAALDLWRPKPALVPPFDLVPVPEAQTGIHSEMGRVLEQVDPRIAHLGKWLLSVGDAVAVADYDNDGRMDLFLTNPLKRPEDRNALYRNLGGFRFERVHFAALAPRSEDPGAYGLASGAVFADYDNDGDADLFICYGYGPSRLLKNTLAETGKPGFEDVTTQAGITGHTISLAANWLDFDRDGQLDLLVANAQAPELPDYAQPTPLNIFRLPAPAHPGDRRPFHFMYNSWHRATNGGPNWLYRNRGDGSFERLDPARVGMSETHWTLAVGTGDLNRDGWTDLYLASDFGPDDLYLNRQGRGFERVEGRWFGDVGKDTYKGMNSTVADFDRNGWLDVYVSNVHHSLQAEGSLLWMTGPGQDAFHPRFKDEAVARGALNERRFGWGAGAGDLDNDGWIDLIQANGMVDDRLDHRYDGYKDYWYFNQKLMQAESAIYAYADTWADLRGRTIYPNEPRRIYWNRQGRFVDVAGQTGARSPDNSRGVALVDLDNDGALDVVITNQHGPVSIYRNTLANGAHWLGLDLRGDGRHTSRFPVGTRVELRYGSEVQTLEVHAANGFASQKDPRVHAGLGTYAGPVDVTVRWAGSGKLSRWRLAPDRYYRLEEPS